MMKDILGKIFAVMFKIFSLCTSIDKNRITFIMTHDDKFNGNLKYIYEEISTIYPKYKINIISKKDYDLHNKKGILSVIKKGFNVFIKKNYYLSRSKYVFLNNIFITGAYLNFKEEVKVIQVWHAIGTFKRFGEEYKPNEKIDELQIKANTIYTDVLVCSSKDIDVYAKAFHIEKNKVKVVGSPCCDLFNNDKRINEIKSYIYNSYSKIKGKQVYLYAPTFRDNDDDNLKIIDYVNQISENLDENSIVLLRLHPHIYKQFSNRINSNKVIDVSNYADVIELMTVCDVLITDYSSLFYEFSYLEKPIIFFAFDLDKYEKDRGFYYEYKSYVPGSIVYSVNDLVNCINKNKFINKSIEFKKNYFDYMNGQSVQRIIDKYIR